MEDRHYIEMVTASAREEREYHEAALRREQSAHVWSALQAVVAVVAMDVLYTDFVNAVASNSMLIVRDCRERLRDAAERAGWLAAPGGQTGGQDSAAVDGNPAKQG